MSCASGQRVRKRQPLGGLSALGGSPCNRCRWRTRSTATSGIGTAEISDRVYGCSGAAKSAADVAISITLPR
jgi:hypothetical protein